MKTKEKEKKKTFLLRLRRFRRCAEEATVSRPPLPLRAAPLPRPRDQAGRPALPCEGGRRASGAEVEEAEVIESKKKKKKKKEKN